MAKRTTPARPVRTRPGQTTSAAPRSARAQGRRLGRKPPPENESRHERFMRIGTKRMNNAIRQIQLLGNLCGPNYDCDAHDLASMRDAIHRELDMALARFTPRKRQGGAAAFTFGANSDETTHGPSV